MNWKKVKLLDCEVQIAKVPFASMMVMLNPEYKSMGLYSEKYQSCTPDALGDLLATSLDGEDVIQFLQRTFKEWSFQASYLDFNAN